MSLHEVPWSQIVVLFDRFSHHSVFFLVFTVFTSNMNFFDHSHSNPPSFCLAGFSPGGPSFEPSFEPSFPKLRSLEHLRGSRHTIKCRDYLVVY